MSDLAVPHRTWHWTLKWYGEPMHPGLFATKEEEIRFLEKQENNLRKELVRIEERLIKLKK